MTDEQGKYQPLTYFQLMEVSLRELLVEKGIVTEEEVSAEVEAMRRRTPERGARVVARAWVDPEFKRRLLADGSRACEELGLEVGALKLVVVENTPGVHNAIVCTLCSCYPRWLLGLPPDWYKSRNYRSRVVREPRTVLHEFGLDLPEHVAVRAVQLLLQPAPLQFGRSGAGRVRQDVRRGAAGVRGRQRHRRLGCADA